MYKIIRRYADSPKRKTNIVTLCNEEPKWRLLGPRKEVTGEVILMAGLRLPPRRQIVLCDTNRSTIHRVLGSVRGLYIQEDELKGCIAWARCPLSKASESKWNDGHLRYFELEIEPRSVRVEREWQGLEGPFHIVESWSPIALCAKCAIGGLD